MAPKGDKNKITVDRVDGGRGSSEEGSMAGGEEVDGGRGSSEEGAWREEKR